ncbi:MAG: Hpt domain-containing protein [Gammaproteobacteria bacterium]|nr:Hpt domain-containing protein [Gammaproteobacteria bacterium]NNL51183.1 Hpt domain-containing protein [Woeseiaceae bacterium]
MATDNENRIDVVDPLARKLVGKYLDNRRDDVGKLTQAVTEADFETIRVTGHNLYGSGAAYGFEEISGIGAGIERAAESRDVPAIQQLIADLRGLLTRLGVG